MAAFTYLKNLGADACRVLAHPYRRSTKPVLSALADYLLTPSGNWAKTDQAWRDLGDSVDYPGITSRVRRAVMDELVSAALADGWPRHPGRYTTEDDQ